MWLCTTSIFNTDVFPVFASNEFSQYLLIFSKFRIILIHVLSLWGTGFPQRINSFAGQYCAQCSQFVSQKMRKTNTRLLIPNTNWEIREVKSGSNTFGTFYRIWEWKKKQKTKKEDNPLQTITWYSFHSKCAENENVWFLQKYQNR